MRALQVNDRKRRGVVKDGLVINSQSMLTKVGVLVGRRSRARLLEASHEWLTWRQWDAFNIQSTKRRRDSVALDQLY